MKSNLFFVLSASCRVVKGFSRSLIIDYGRGNIYFISLQYAGIIPKLDRKRVSDVFENLEDEESVGYLNDFISFLLDSEIGFLTNDPKRFPSISNHVDEDYITLQDVIIELDKKEYSKIDLINLCKDLSDLNCKDFQIRLLSNFDVNFLSEVVEIINMTTNANYLEIHCTYNKTANTKVLHSFIEDQILISKIFVYNAPSNVKYRVVNEIEGYYPISLGEVYYIDYPFDNGNCCGIINHENLNFTSFHLHNKLKTKNGCLDKKITIDKCGNIKNCPSMENEYGNIKNTSIKEVIKNRSFLKFWNINKDQISTCKVCEFRYNCLDCRAFIEYEKDIYSKPSKCSYNPITCTWNN